MKDLSSATVDLVDSTDVYMVEKAQFIRESANEFENTATLLTTMADVVVHSGKYILKHLRD